jgi:hypothetical protein
MPKQTGDTPSPGLIGTIFVSVTYNIDSCKAIKSVVTNIQEIIVLNPV